MDIYYNFRLHSRKLAVKRLNIAATKTVSNLHRFKNVTETKMQDLRKTQLKK